MGLTVVRVDAFTAEAFGGNPAAVCLLPAARPRAWMQALARELNAPATAFVGPAEPAPRWLRWYSPAAELSLCGHGTLAACHVLWERGERAERLAFATPGGTLAATQRDGWIALDLAAEPAAPAPVPTGLLEALGAPARAVLRNRLDYLVEVADEAVVRALAPDLGRLAAVETRGVIVTAPAASGDAGSAASGDAAPAASGDAGSAASGDAASAASGDADFVSRFFAPRAGIPEDFVTGSAHCGLGPYWSARLGRIALVGRQLSARGGLVRVEVAGDRVRLSGRAVTLGTFTLDA
jgi:predicted PhzF superfamily epimerase YddE/YHI9